MVSKEFKQFWLVVAIILIFLLGLILATLLFFPSLGHSWKIFNYIARVTEDWDDMARRWDE